jgi:mRNA interferase HicA
VKRDDLVRALLAAGCVLQRHGGRHDIYVNPRIGQKQPVPRHREIDEALARHIQKFLGLKKS